VIIASEASGEENRNIARRLKRKKIGVIEKNSKAGGETQRK
jgi:hypothetical protein